MTLHTMFVLLLIVTGARRGRTAASPDDFDKIEVFPTRPPTSKEAKDSGASLADAMRMPWFPWHKTQCGDRPCKPGEGNLKGYRFWGQPYIHREDYVQSRKRYAPHGPDANTTYAHLIRMAAKVQLNSMVIVAAADWDWREIIMNWFIHNHRLGYYNSLALSMDTDLHRDLRKRNLPSYDDSAQLDAWNVTCLQRHIQRVRMERLLCVAALVSGGFDVLHTDATAVFVTDFVPTYLRSQPANVDILMQRENAPPNVIKKTGCGVNAGFVYVRGATSSKRQSLTEFLSRDVLRRGLVEFYHRWNNVVDHFGWTHMVNENDLDTPTSVMSNESTRFNLHLPRHCSPGPSADGCLRVGFLPHNVFPRFTDRGWPSLAPVAAIHHIVGDGGLGKGFDAPVGTKPFAGHRQRLDRYDDADFASYKAVMQDMGLWLVDKTPEYRLNSRAWRA